MSHQRETIRGAVVSLLTSGNTDAGNNVFSNRKNPLWQEELPAILVSTEEETAEPRDIQGKQSIRTMQLRIDCKIEAVPSVEDDLDDLCDDVEEILADSPSLSGTALDAVYKSTVIATDVDGEKEIGTATLIYEVKYIK